MAEECGVLDIVEEADLDGRVGEVRQGDGLHGGDDTRKLRCLMKGVVIESHHLAGADVLIGLSHVLMRH